MTVNELFNAIDNLEIYSRDYNIISSLLQHCSPKTFKFLVEKVLDSNNPLEWEDFEEFLSNTNYHTVLTNNIAQQDELENYINKLNDLYVKIYGTEALENHKQLIGRDADLENDADRTGDLAIKDNLVFEILRPSTNDSAMQSLYKMIMLKDFLDEDHIEDRDNILMYIKKMIVPIDYKYQSIDEYDRAFMKQNNISEDMMKKIKSLGEIFNVDYTAGGGS